MTESYWNTDPMPKHERLASLGRRLLFPTVCRLENYYPSAKHTNPNDLTYTEGSIIRIHDKLQSGYVKMAYFVDGVVDFVTVSSTISMPLVGYFTHESFTSTMLNTVFFSALYQGANQLLISPLLSRFAKHQGSK